MATFDGGDSTALPGAAVTPGAASEALPAVEPRARRRWLRGVLIALAVLVLATAGALVALATVGGAYRAEEVPGPSAAVAAAAPDAKRLERAESRVEAAGPHAAYIAVDTYRNRLRFYRDGKLQREAKCSTGSGVVLRDPRDGHQWVFDTPQGEYQVQRKVKHPIWAKPDWAFIEDGYLPPPSGSPARFDDFSLGDYAMYMADGYIIHGTVFPNLLGQRVTHGCIRLGDEDLVWVFKNTPVGTKVYLY